jgi:hypothetical protein
MMILKISFVEDAIIHVNFAEDLRNSNVRRVDRVEIDIPLINTFNKFLWFNVNVPQTWYRNKINAYPNSM